ncbi:hypothetical protein RYX36_005544, partial [Vicia faba]
MASTNTMYTMVFSIHDPSRAARAYIKCDNLKNARKVFDKTLERINGRHERRIAANVGSLLRDKDDVIVATPYTDSILEYHVVIHSQIENLGD